MNRKTALLVIIGLLITYGSLYPFDFAAPAGGAWQRLLAGSAGGSSRGDIIGNIALFIPWGLVGMLALASGRAGLQTFGLGFILALGVQIVQIWIPSRTPALYDVAWNMVGCAIGALVGRYFVHRQHRLTAERQPLALWLLLAWILLEWLPLVPSLDFQLIKQQLKGLLTAGMLDIGEIALRFALALLLGELIDRCWRPVSGRAASVWLFWLLPALVAAVLAGKLLLVGTTLTTSAVFGYGAGIVGWWLLARASDERRSIVIVTALVLAYSISALLPLSLKTTASSFDFMPFAGLLAGSMLDNARALASSLLLFFSALYLLRDGGARTMVSAAALAIWVLLLECLQMFITARSTSITEPLLVLVAGVLVANLHALNGAEAHIRTSTPHTDNDADMSAPPAQSTRKRAIQTRLLAAGIALFLIVGSLKIVLGLPSIPYNLAELFQANGSIPALTAFALMLLWMGAGAAWLGQRLAHSAQPAILFLPACIFVALVSLVLLKTSVTGESLRDIVGAPDYYRLVVSENIWGDAWRAKFLRLGNPDLIKSLETALRYWALYTPLPAWLGLAIYLRAQAVGRGQHQSKASRITLAIVAAFILWLCKAIAFDWNSTDNLVELIAPGVELVDGLYLGGGIFLYGLLLLVCLNALLLAGAPQARYGRRLLTILISLAALPAGWWLLKMGLDPQIEKYGQTFSGVQFLLGPDRVHGLSESQLFTRWGAVQVAGTGVLAFGLWLGRIPPLAAYPRNLGGRNNSDLKATA